MLLDWELYGFIDGTEILADGAEEDATTKYNKRQQAAMTALIMSVNEKVVALIHTCEKPAEAYKVLKSLYKKT